MTTFRQIARVIPSREQQDGAGVKLRRSIGLNQACRLDPFLMLDAFASDNPNDYMAGFPAHPHRGFETVTYMLEGKMQHRDHMGNEATLSAGSVQWMCAGRGVIHEEMTLRENGMMRGFQLWINLPAKDKMSPAAYQDLSPEMIPSFKDDQVAVKVIAGRFEQNGQVLKGPVQGKTTDPYYLDIQLAAGAELNLTLPKHHQAFIYSFEGRLAVSENFVETHAATILTEGELLRLHAGEEGARLLLIAGKPIQEPVVQYGPFVMNTMAEIDQAISDYRQGVLTQ